MSRRPWSPRFFSRFECYRVEDEPVMKALGLVRGQGDPGWFIPLDCLVQDWSAAAALGDLLIARGDPRGEQIARMVASNDFGAFWPLFGLAPAHRAYLEAFSRTRRMQRDAEQAAGLPDRIRIAAGLPVGAEGGYFVGGGGESGEESDASVEVSAWTTAPADQPGSFCGWVPSADGTALLPADLGSRRSENSVGQYEDWLAYLIERFIAPWGYLLNGQVSWEQEDDEGNSQQGVIRRLKNEPC